MASLLRMSIIGLLLITPTWSLSHAQLLERIQRLEQKLIDQESLKVEIAELKDQVEELQFMAEEPSDDEDVKSFSGGLTFGGYVDMEYIHRNDSGKSAPGDFDQHRFIFDVSAELGSKMKFVSEIEFEHAASEIAMEQAYLDYNFENSFGFRTGSILVPIGRFNFLHDAPLRELTERPKVNRIIVPTTWFDIGAGFFGEGGSEKYPVSWELYVMNGFQDDGDKLKSGTGLRGLRKKGRSDSEQTHNKALTGRAGFSLNEETQIGLSFYQADVGAYIPGVAATNTPPLLQGKRDLSMWGIDWERQLNDRLEWLGEYISGDVDANIATAALGYDFSGWYSQLNYILDQDEKYRVIYRWGRTDTAKGMTNSGDITESVLGLSYRPNSNAVFRLEYHWEDELNTAGASLDNNGIVLGAATFF